MKIGYRILVAIAAIVVPPMYSIWLFSLRIEWLNDVMPLPSTDGIFFTWVAGFCCLFLTAIALVMLCSLVYIIYGGIYWVVTGKDLFEEIKKKIKP